MRFTITCKADDFGTVLSGLVWERVRITSTCEVEDLEAMLSGLHQAGYQVEAVRQEGTSRVVEAGKG